MGIILLILGLLLFVGLVVIHEFGHFIAARRNGVEVEEFGIGFPPRAWKKRVKSDKGDYDFTLNWLPLGGFVKLKGENDDADAPGTFGAASLSAKVKIMVAGVIMNLLAAFVLFTGVAWIGMPTFPGPNTLEHYTVASDEKIVQETIFDADVVVLEVFDDSVAAEVGVQQGDVVRKINNETIVIGSQLASVLAKRHQEGVVLVVEREDELLSFDIPTSVFDAADQGLLGISTETNVNEFQIGIKKYTWSAPIVAVGTIGQFTNLTFQGLGSALAGFGQYLASFVTGDEVSRTEGSTQATEQVTGPLGIVLTLFAVSQEGIGILLFVIALISLALAIMNILPIPALDGGRLFVTLLFRAIRKPLHKSVEERIHATGFLLLMMLFVLITVVDVRRFF